MAVTAGLHFAGIPAGKFRRIGGVSWLRQLVDVPMQANNLRDIGRIYRGYRQARRLIHDFKPDVVFVKGGGVGMPVGRAAHSLGVPLVVHESDVVPGLGTKLLSGCSSKIAVGFPVEAYAGGILPASKLVYIGAPLPPGQTSGTIASARKRFKLDAKRQVILVLGGSQGSRAINQAVIAQIKSLAAAGQLIHQAGEGELPSIMTQPAARMPGYQVYGFLDASAMGDAYAVADIVIARAGANTIADLAANAKPAIIIPNQESAAHQLANARWLSKFGAAEILSEDDIDSLATVTTKLLHSPDRLKRLSRTISTLDNPEAASKLAELIEGVSGHKSAQSSKIGVRGSL